MDQQMDHVAKVMAKVMVIYWFSLGCAERGPAGGPHGQCDGQTNGDLLVLSQVC